MFLIQLICSSQCKWIPRRDESNPKTIDQIHKEAQKEEQERQIFLQQATAQQKAQGGRGGGARGLFDLVIEHCVDKVLLAVWNMWISKRNSRIWYATNDDIYLFGYTWRPFSSLLKLHQMAYILKHMQHVMRYLNIWFILLGSRGPPGSGMGASDGWNTVGKPNIRVERQSIDPSRLKITKVLDYYPFALLVAKGIQLR